MILIYGTHVYMIISPGAFLFFQNFDFLGC